MGCRTPGSGAAPDTGQPQPPVAQTGSTQPHDGGALDAPAAGDKVRRLTRVRFDKAALFMPAVEDDGGAPPLAPLIVVNMSWARTVTLNSVQVSAGALDVAGQSYQTLDYSWFLDARRDFGSLGVVEGYRLSLLLGADGFPIVARVVRLRPDARARPLYFVSRSLEDAAIERFGSPLPGRAFAVEPSLDRAADFFVAGVFDDGPVPMGPYVYLDPNGVGVVTVLCRCAPSQMEDVAMTAYYDLVDVPGRVRAGNDVHDPLPALVDVLRWPFRASGGDDAVPEAPR